MKIITSYNSNSQKNNYFNYRNKINKSRLSENYLKNQPYDAVSFLGAPSETIYFKINKLLREKNSLLLKRRSINNTPRDRITDAELADIRDNLKLQTLNNKIIEIKASTNRTIKTSIDRFFNSKGFLNSRIAGYSKEKAIIKTDLIRAIKYRNKNNNKVPNCLILAGPSGMGKKTFANAIKEELKDSAEFVDFTKFLYSNDIDAQLTRQMDLSKERYLKTGKHTILFIDNGESLFSINPSDAKILGINLSNEDELLLNKFGNNSDRIGTFKSTFDSLSDAPDKKGLGFDAKSAMTMLITTSNPHLIHPDILHRKGKATVINLNVPSTQDNKKIIKFNQHKLNNIIEKLKEQKSNPYFEEAIRSLDSLSPEAKENLVFAIKDGTIDKFNVNISEADYKRLIPKLAPNKESGAFSNSAYKKIMYSAFISFMENDLVSNAYVRHMLSAIDKSPRDIPSIASEEIQNKMPNIANIEKFDEIQTLLTQMEIGLLSPKSEEKLISLMCTIDQELEKLSNLNLKRELTVKQQEQKQELEQIRSRFLNNS